MLKISACVPYRLSRSGCVNWEAAEPDSYLLLLTCTIAPPCGRQSLSVWMPECLSDLVLNLYFMMFSFHVAWNSSLSTSSRCLWPRLLSSRHMARRVKATTAQSALRRGRQRANTGCLLCVVVTSLASPASSAGWKLRARPLNVHRSAKLQEQEVLISYPASHLTLYVYVVSL